MDYPYVKCFTVGLNENPTTIVRGDRSPLIKELKSCDLCGP